MTTNQEIQEYIVIADRIKSHFAEQEASDNISDLLARQRLKECPFSLE